jgi:hypothetical protein
MSRYELAKALAGATAAATLMTMPTAGMTAPPVGYFQGGTYGTFASAKAGPVAASLGRSAALGASCAGTGGTTQSRTVSNVQAGDNGNVLKVGTIRDTVVTSTSANAVAGSNRSTVSGLSVLDGLITAGSIAVVANVSATSRAITTDTNGTLFQGLTVAGKAVRPDVHANTRYALPGLGSVIINRVIKGASGDQTGTVSVDGLTIFVTEANHFNLPLGVKIIVAHASNGFTRGAAVTFNGQAFAATANDQIGTTLLNEVGEPGRVGVGCEGGNSTAQVSQVNAPPVLTAASGVSTAVGKRITGGGVARTTSTVQGLTLLNGLITAAEVKAVAQETVRNGVSSRSTSGSGFDGLKIVGQITLPISIPPNTKLPLPGIGFVVLNEQMVPSGNSKASTVVNGIHLVVNTINLWHIPVGTEVIVAHAQANAAAPGS